MHKKVAFDLRLPNGNLRKISFKFPIIRGGNAFVVDLINVLSNIFTTLFFLFIFIPRTFNFSRVGEIDFVIVVYTFVIIMAFFQFVRFIFGGEEFFPKVAYDLLILLLPPLIILPLVINNNLSVGMFATLPTWNIAGISLISIVILCYIIAVNYSKNTGYKNINFWMDAGLIIANLVAMVVPLHVVANVDVIPVLLLPVNLYKLFKVNSFRLKISSLLLIIIAIFQLVSGSFLNYGIIPFGWDLQRIMFVLNFAVLTYFLVKLVINRKQVSKSFSRFFGSTTLIIKVPNFKKNPVSLAKLAFWIYLFASTLYLLLNGFVGEYVNVFTKEVSSFIGTLNPMRFAVGSTTTSYQSYLLTFLDTYGFITGAVFFGGIILIVLRNINKVKTPEFVASIMALGILMVTAFFFQLSISILLVLFVTIASILINLRSGEFDLEDIKLAKSKPRGKAATIIFNLIKVAITLLSLAGVIIVIASLTQIIGRNLG